MPEPKVSAPRRFTLLVGRGHGGSFDESLKNAKMDAAVPEDAVLDREKESFSHQGDIKYLPYPDANRLNMVDRIVAGASYKGIGEPIAAAVGIGKGEGNFVFATAWSGRGAGDEAAIYVEKQIREVFLKKSLPLLEIQIKAIDEESLEESTVVAACAFLKEDVCLRPDFSENSTMDAGEKKSGCGDD